MNVSRVSANVETNLGNEVTISGVSQDVDTSTWLRLQVVGSNPSTLRLRAWAAGQSEPTTWQYSTTDSTAALQTAGAVGVRAYLSSSGSNTPVLISFDDSRSRMLFSFGWCKQSLEFAFYSQHTVGVLRAEGFIMPSVRVTGVSDRVSKRTCGSFVKLL